MQIFSSEQLRKINFIDENNFLLGFNTDQNCCERFGFFIADRPTIDPIDDKGNYKCDPFESNDEAYKDYVFDPEYYHKFENPDEELVIVIFRIVEKDAIWRSKYLHLYNMHNGYYAHQYTFGEGKKVIREEYL